MKVGDLIKVYNFTHRARKKFRAQGIPPSSFYGHFVGLIVGRHGDLHGVRRVMRPDGSTEFYNLDRMEIINESR